MSSNVVLFPDSKSHLLSECAVNVVISVVVVEALVGRGIHDLVVGVSQCGGWGTTVIGPELHISAGRGPAVQISAASSLPPVQQRY